jgi:hypothetical protein
MAVFASQGSRTDYRAALINPRIWARLLSNLGEFFRQTLRGCDPDLEAAIYLIPAAINNVSPVCTAGARSGMPGYPAAFRVPGG